jgi:MFS family permease
MDLNKDKQVTLDGSGGRSKTYMVGLLLMMFLAMGLIMMDRQLPLYLGSFLIKDLGLSNTQFGLMATAMGIGWGFSALVFGYFSDIVGRRVIVIPAVIIMSLCSVGTGLAPAFAVLFLFRVLMGVSEAPAVALLPGIVQEEAPASKRGRYTGWVMSSGALFGSFIAPICGTWLAINYGWRMAFYVICIPGIILGLFMWKFLKEPPSSMNMKEKRAAGTTIKEKYDFRAVAKNKNVWLAALCGAMYTGGANLFYSFGPLYMIVDKGFDPATVSYIMGGCGFSNFIWMLITPMISDRIGRRLTLIIFGIISIGLPLALIYVTSSALLIPIVYVISVNAGMIPLIMVLVPAESVGPKLMGSALGINLLFGEILGGALWPLVGGVIADKYGYGVPMFVYMGLCGAIAVIALFMYETAPRVLAKRAAKAGNVTAA